MKHGAQPRQETRAELAGDKRSHEAADSERSFRIMADTAPVLIWQSNAGKLCCYFNKPWLDFTGRTMDEELGYGWAEGVHPHDLDHCIKIYESAFDARQRFTIEYRLRRNDGEYRWVLDNGVPIYSDTGNFSGYIGSCIDITDRKQAEASLLENQIQLAGIIQTAIDAIITVDSRGRVILFNAAAEEMFGCRAGAAIGRSLDYFIQERFDVAHPKLAELFDNTNTVSPAGSFGAISGHRADGTEFPIEASISQSVIGDDKISTLIIRDLTSRKMAERALTRQARLLDLSHEAILVWDLHGDILYWNHGAEELYGWKKDEVLGCTSHVLLKTVFPIPCEQIHDLLLTENRWAGELVQQTSDGRSIVVEARLLLVREDDGQPYVLETDRDVTERKRSEEQLRNQAALLDKATDAILVKDRADRITLWSKGAERLYGWTATEAVGRRPQELGYWENDREFKEAKRVLLETGQWRGEAQHTTKDGDRLTVDNRWTLLRDGDGKPESVLVINTDITEKKKLETQFLRAQRLDSLGTLAGGIAHDLNNILAPIMMAVGILEMKLPDEDSRRVLNLLHSNVERGGNLVRQILDFARGVEGTRSLLQPERLMAEIVIILKDTLSKSIDIRTVVGQNLWRIDADPTQIQQVVINLVINAAEAMPRGGTVMLEAKNVMVDESFARMNFGASVGPHLCISIRDTGPGIPGDVIDRIFDPFFTTKEQTQGAGLGLSTVLTLVKSHGGFIDLNSEEGRGSEFMVYLPASPFALTSQPEAGAELPRGDGQLILVTDDEPAIREITRKTLEAYGYHVITAADGTEAVALFAQQKQEVKLVLTDVMMPYMDGPALIRAITKMRRDIKVIVSSGLRSNSRLAEGRIDGARAFLWKPYTAETLIKTVAEVLAS